MNDFTLTKTNFYCPFRQDSCVKQCALFSKENDELGYCCLTQLKTIADNLKQNDTNK